MDAKPNILLIYSDQHRYDCVGANGHPLIKTPNMDRLASEGMNFSHAFCPIPLCVPARNSLVHGVWPTTHLTVANTDTEAPRPPEEGLPTFVAPLRAAGYHLGYVGKWHVNSSRDPVDYGFEDYYPLDNYYEWLDAKGKKPTGNVSGYFGERETNLGPDETRLAWGAEKAVELVEKCSHGDKPFFVTWATRQPHIPNNVPEPYYSMYPPESIPRWPGFPDPLSGKPYIQAQQRRTWGVEDWAWRDWAPFVSHYLADISLLDTQLGKVLDYLDETGLAENTVVIYTTDHGDMCGNHGMIDKHYVMYEDVVRVPLMVRWPGRIPGGAICEDFVCNALDLAATFCHLAGVEMPGTFEGQSLLPLLAENGHNDRSDIFVMYHGNQFGLFSQRMVRDRRWKYIWNATAEDELYDLENDPGEISNLATAPECAEELSRLRKRVVQWMEEISDRLLNDWTRKQLLEGRKV